MSDRVIDPRLLDGLLDSDQRNGDEPDAVGSTASSTWTPIDLSAALDGIDVPPPSVLHRADGMGLLYAGRTHGFAGEPEACKSWAAQVAAQQVLTEGHNVLWVDFEDDERGLVSRLRSLLVPREAIAAHFTYLHPDEPLRSSDGRSTIGAMDLEHLLAAKAWTLIAIDGVTEAMVTEGLDPMNNADVARWSRRLPKRCASTGAAVVMLDHVPKASDNRGRYAIGGQHKLAGLTGAQYVFDVERPFSRATHDAVTGIIRITVTKDRPGHVRSHARDGVVARLELTSHPDSAVTATLQPPDASDAPIDMKLAVRIAAHLTIYPRSSKNALEKEITGKSVALRATLTAMVNAGWVAVEQRGQSHLHSLTDAGTAHFAP